MINTGENVYFSPPLFIQRLRTVKNLLRLHRCRRIIDAGCNDGSGLTKGLLSWHLSDFSLSHLLAVDLSRENIVSASDTAVPDSFCFVELLQPCNVYFAQGNLTQCAGLMNEVEASTENCWLDSIRTALEGEEVKESIVDAVVSVEVVEHIHPQKVEEYSRTIFDRVGAALGASIIIITTPNSDFNHVFPQNNSSTAADAEKDPFFWQYHHLRRSDHYFEWSGTRFRIYCNWIVSAFRTLWGSYRIYPIGGGFSQLAVFYRSGGTTTMAEEEPRFPFELLFGTSNMFHELPPVSDEVVSTWRVIRHVSMHSENLWKMLMIGGVTAVKQLSQVTDNGLSLEELEDYWPVKKTLHFVHLRALRTSLLELVRMQLPELEALQPNVQLALETLQIFGGPHDAQEEIVEQDIPLSLLNQGDEEKKLGSCCAHLRMLVLYIALWGTELNPTPHREDGRWCTCTCGLEEKIPELVQLIVPLRVVVSDVERSPSEVNLSSLYEGVNSDIDEWTS